MGRYSNVSAEELCRACADPRDAEAWNEFVHRFHRPISLSVIRVTRRWRGYSQQLVEDLIQETYLKLCNDKCRLLHEFSVQHPEAINGYVKTIAINVAQDYFRSLNARKRGGGYPHVALEDTEPHATPFNSTETAGIERWVLLREIGELLSTAVAGTEGDRDITIFWLHYRQGLSAKTISELPTFGLSAKGVESVIFRLTEAVRRKFEPMVSESAQKA